MTPQTEQTTHTPKRTLFYQCHVDAGAKMVPFAGYEMPIQYPAGILKEHEWVRTRAGLFDVSHMGQCILAGADAAANLARLTPSSFGKMPIGKAKYTVLLNPEGGIIDDLIVTRLAETQFYMVINAACKAKDIEWIQQNLSGDATFTVKTDGAPLIALQGPYAEQVLQEALLPNVKLDELPYMFGMPVRIMGSEAFITRTGYTGEDGFELALPEDPEKARHIWQALTAHADVQPIGLGARDSLRLEMGYPLYGHDLNDTTSPVEADIKWVIGKKNTTMFGHDRLRQELTTGPKRIRVGIALTEKGIAREDSPILSPDGTPIGMLTSGGFSPTTKQAIGQGYVDVAHAVPGKTVLVEVRNRRLQAKVHALNFVNPRTLKPGA